MPVLDRSRYDGAELFSTILGAGLRIQRVVEPGEVEIPHVLAVLADKPGPALTTLAGERGHATRRR